MALFITARINVRYVAGALLVAFLFIPVCTASSGYTEGRKLFFKNDYEGALNAFEKDVKAGRETSILWYLIGQSYESLAQNQSAKSAYQKAVKLKPDFALARIRLARLCYLLEESDCAFQQYSYISKHFPEELKEADHNHIGILDQRTALSSKHAASIAAPDSPDFSKAPGKGSTPSVITDADSEDSRGSSLAEAGEAIPSGTDHYFAMIIAVEKYDHSQHFDLPNLKYPIADAKRLVKVLITHYSFKKERIWELYNPTRTEIIKKFDGLREEIKPTDNLLIFYAGHGKWDEDMGTGYWLPRDAQKSDKSKWLSNSTVHNYIKAIKSRHTLLISDSCYSGGILETREAFGNEGIAFERLYQRRSRKAMTSGHLETVPDKSVFAEYLIKYLERNPRNYIPANILFSLVQEPVIYNSPKPKPVPQYGPLDQCGHEGGEFIFIKKNKTD